MVELSSSDDHSRVKLVSDDKDGRGNYINANYVDVTLKTRIRELSFILLLFDRAIIKPMLTLPRKAPCPIRSMIFGEWTVPLRKCHVNSDCVLQENDLGEGRQCTGDDHKHQRTWKGESNAEMKIEGTVLCSGEMRSILATRRNRDLRDHSGDVD